MSDVTQDGPLLDPPAHHDPTTMRQEIPPSVGHAPAPPKTLDPAGVLVQLSSEEKIALLSGDDMWHTAAIPRLAVPRVRTSDGPNGVRGTSWNGPAASCFPCSTALGASFDQDLARRVGEALGRECRARGVHCLLGPTTNIQRHPYGGRGFESFGEDPHLSGHMAKAWIEGVHSENVMTTPKHLVGNEQEYLRRSNNSVIDLRTLHEIYLEPFRIQLQANPSVVMSSYNRVNGVHVAEDLFLLRDILRGDYGFKGLLMSDWSGTISGAQGIKAGLDLEMPGPALVRGTCVERDIVTGKLVPADVDECVLRVLEFVREAQASGIPFEAPDGSADSPGTRALLREAASAGIVLLKNEGNLLPLRPEPGQRIAVIGHNAKYPAISGGGSAALNPTYITTPLEAITSAAEASNCSVHYAHGVDGSRFLPLLTPHLSVSREGPKGQVQCLFYDQNPWESHAEPMYSKAYHTSFCFFHDGIPKSVPVRGYVSLKAFFRPDTTGVWELGLGVNGQADLYIDGKLAIENSRYQKVGLLFFNTGTEERTCQLEVEAGRAYELEVRFSNFQQLNAMSPYSGRRGGIRVGGRFIRAQEEMIAEAVTLAQSAHVAIVVVGTTPEWESEAYDRTEYHLPPGTDELIERVLAVCPQTVIVNQSGMPVALPWLERAPALLQAWFAGNDNGGGLADVLFGQTNPSGKLPVTWAQEAEDWPSHAGFGHPTDTVYSEGLAVGYRHFDTPGAPKSLFPFGYGLSYTTFVFSDLKVNLRECGAEVSFSVSNTGTIAGAEVAQVYIHAHNQSVHRPEAELCGFSKVDLQAGETRRMAVTLDHAAFSYYDVVRKTWVAPSGNYEIRVGSSSRHVALAAPLALSKTWVWKGLDRPIPL